jgi:hypothetical protein
MTDDTKLALDAFRRARMILQEGIEVQQHALKLAKGVITEWGEGPMRLHDDDMENAQWSRVHSRKMSEIVTGDVKPDGTQG